MRGPERFWQVAQRPAANDGPPASASAIHDAGRFASAVRISSLSRADPPSHGRAVEVATRGASAIILAAIEFLTARL